MALGVSSATVEARVALHIPAGERFVVAFQATIGHDPNPFRFRYRVVAVTDQRIHLFAARWLRSCDPGTLLASFPSGTTIERRRDRVLHDEVWIGAYALSVAHAWSDELADAMAAADRH